MRRQLRLCVNSLERRIAPDSTPHNLAVSNFCQNWNDATLIAGNDDWSGVLSVVGFLGDDTIGEGVDPQTVMSPYFTADVIANLGSDTLLTEGGVAEFDDLTNPVVALQGDGTAEAPNLVISIDTTSRSNISISYNLRDIDGTADNAIQPVALQYRVGSAGNFINVPSGFVADATTGPNLATKVTPVNVTLPSAVNDQSLVQIRIMVTNAVGDDEWVGVDDIVVGNREFAINTYTTGNQSTDSARAVAMDANGDSMVVWPSPGQDASLDGVFGQRFDSAGTKTGGEFQINTYTTNSQNGPSVAVDADGGAVVVWQSFGQDGKNYGIYGQRINLVGSKIGAEFQINTYTTNSQNSPSVAVDADGDAMVVWQSFGQDGTSYGIYGQRFNSSGTKVGDESPINTYTTNGQSYPSVAVDADGDAMVVWSSQGQDGSNDGVYGQRFDAAGMKVGGEFPVNTYTTGTQRFPSVAMDADGDSVVVWESAGQDGSGYGIYGQQFDSAGTKVGEEFQINSYTTGTQRNPSVVMDGDGDIVVVWESNVQDGSGYGVYQQRFNSMGVKVGTEFQVNIYATSHQKYASVAADADGDTMVALGSNGQDGSGYGVYGQRFRSPNPPIKFSNSQINDGFAQRSMVTSLKVNFDSSVTFAGSPAATFSLVNQMTSNAATLSAAVDPSGTAVTLTFTGGSVDLGGSLSDGRYTLTIIGSQFTGNGFDANGDGITGDNYVLIGSPANGLFRLFGDSDGNGTVNSVDFATFRTFFGIGPSMFDFNNDGQTNSDDFAKFRKRFGLMI